MRYDAPALTADGRSENIELFNPRGRDGSGRYTAFVTGTFGGGTATPQLSPDGGTTWVTIQDAAGDVTFTENGAFNFEVFSDPIQPIEFSVNLTGATSPNITIVVTDAK
jgi:hypothetical protein